ncbi:hypothetical protein JNM05_10975 [bacterium]|nr:hypothetical protein [bacterium]
MQAKLRPEIKSGIIFTVLLIAVAVLYSYLQKKGSLHSIVAGAADVDSFVRPLLKKSLDNKYRIPRYVLYAMIVVLFPVGIKFWSDLKSSNLEGSRAAIVFVIPIIIALVVMALYEA